MEEKAAEQSDRNMMFLKVMDKNRKRRYGVAVHDFEELKERCCSVFHHDTVKIVLEGDGTEVSDTVYLRSLEPQTCMIVLLLGEEWEAEQSSSGSSGMQGESRMEYILDQVKRKRVQTGNNVKPDPIAMKITCGWMNFSYKEKRYISIRTQKGGGTRTLEVLRTSGYEELIIKLTDSFFPKGKSPLGKITKYTTKIGDSSGNEIKKQEFSLKDMKTYKMLKLYLLTKEQIFSIETSESDSDFDLPEISFGNSTRKSGPSISSTTNVTVMATQGPPINTHSGTQGSLINPQSGPQGSPINAHSGNSQISLFNTGTPTVQFNLPTECEICKMNEKTHFLVPCGHTFCLSCANQIVSSNKLCAFCRQPILKVNPIYN